MELLSVIIPAYNAEKTIARAVKSIIQQNYTAIEVIIINDGSVDNTDYICRKLAEKDLRIRYFEINNCGVSNARNIGLDVAQGSFVTFLDADDFVQPQFLESLVEEMDNNTDLVCEGYIAVSEDGKELFKQNIPSARIDSNNYYKGIEVLQDEKAFNILWNKLFRKSIIEHYHIRMNTTISMGEDLLFVLEYLKYCKNQMCLKDRTEYRYVLSKNGLQATFKDDTNLRLKQLDSIKELYTQKVYPMNGFYIEALRVFYVVILGSDKTENAITIVTQSSIFNEMKLRKIYCIKKFKLFWVLLKIKNISIIKWSVKAFGHMKLIKGDSYKW